MSLLQGVIHGKTIELDQSPGLPDGQRVTVAVEPQVQETTDERLDALKRAAGGWSDDIEGLDRYLEWNRQQRKLNRPEITE